MVTRHFTMVAPIIAPMPADIPLAALTTINFQKLRSSDAGEKQKLWEAATEAGFFYLNYENMPEFEDLTATINDIYDLERDIFNLSDEEKMKYDVDKQGNMKISGYKPIGRNIGGLEGKRDGHESWAIPKSGVFSLSDTQFDRPPLLESRLTTVRTFMQYAQTFTTVIHGILSDQLGMQGKDRLERFHRPDHSCLSILRLLKVHAQPLSSRGHVHTPHTDIGSLTVLLSNTPGLQILAHNAAGGGTGEVNWEFVAPRANCAVINLGDSLSMMTGGRTASALHRVGPLPGQPMGTRYSFAYLQRPETRTVVKVGMGPTTGGLVEEISIEEWIKRKFGMLRKESYRHGEQWVLTGRQGRQVIAA
ncbi:oxidoreductase 2OG-Fe(II) oxygenase family [Pyrenophora seminiperda CCB06]|uniref:Oxidoreductase 2OG-Fe(II) oxygenase family n=1 Tax=Pyrenophora seminiperda CCB06 TaxID=1302712 RepID=A0A3M7M9M6_9PLEO|nr:oxidoreductase 2OG-Fe(II) oxygenase family [Pyrenophora seminiperda CCB06]